MAFSMVKVSNAATQPIALKNPNALRVLFIALRLQAKGSACALPVQQQT
ncbi:hypothetical protein [Pseudomonas versuta]|nr:hypothetical protein [Pseudomonas versuta]